MPEPAKCKRCGHVATAARPVHDTLPGVFVYTHLCDRCLDEPIPIHQMFRRTGEPNA